MATVQTSDWHKDRSPIAISTDAKAEAECADKQQPINRLMQRDHNAQRLPTLMGRTTPPAALMQ